MGSVHLLLGLFAITYVAAQGPGGKAPGLDGGQSQIIGGQDADKGEYPFMVRIYIKELGHMCGGSLLSRNIVLTAAHCVSFDGMKIPIDMVVAIVGDHTSTETEDTERSLEWSRIIVHEDYYTDLSGAPVNDIALIVLKEDVTTGGPIATIKVTDDSSQCEAGTAVTVAGWGISGDTPDPETGMLPLADALQELEYVIADKEACKEYWKADYVEYVKDYLPGHEIDVDELARVMLCAEDPEREATTWKGDSGGPLFITEGSEKIQVGVVSWGGLDPTDITYNMYTNLCNYGTWIHQAMDRASHDSWLELSTGGSHGMVMVHDKEGGVTTICSDKVGESEINAICREQGYKMGALADVRDYLPGGRKQKNQEFYDLPPYGYTNMNCGDDAKDAMTQCTMTKYEESEVPCFHGQQLAVKCADTEWEFKITYMVPEFKSVKGSQFAKGKIGCVVQAQKYGIPLDIKSQVRVGLVIRGEDGIEDIEGRPMKYRKKTGIHIGKFKPTDEIMADSCFACIAYLPGTEFYSVATFGRDDCPDNEDQYMDWVRKQNDADDGGHDGSFDDGGS